MPKIPLKNIGLYLLVAGVTLVITVTAFASKAITYQDNAGTVMLTVRKKEFKVASQTTGTVAEVRAEAGQRVKKGDIIAVINNEVLDKQIARLQQLSTANDSASVQLIALQTEKEAQTIYAPADGVVAEVLGQGESVNVLDKFATIYADGGVLMTGTFTVAQYNELQNRLGSLKAESRRLDAEFPVTYQSLSQQVAGGNEYESDVRLYFAPGNQDDATSLLQGEKVVLHMAPKQNTTKPIDVIINAYRELLGR